MRKCIYGIIVASMVIMGVFGANTQSHGYDIHDLCVVQSVDDTNGVIYLVNTNGVVMSYQCDTGDIYIDDYYIVTRNNMYDINNIQYTRVDLLVHNNVQ